jgi:hypothetical protein
VSSTDYGNVLLRQGRARTMPSMLQIENAIVTGGKVTLVDLPFPDGQEVCISVVEAGKDPTKKMSIDDVRQLLKGGVAHFDDPFEPMIPLDDWEMLK